MRGISDELSLRFGRAGRDARTNFPPTAQFVRHRLGQALARWHENYTRFRPRTLLGGEPPERFFELWSEKKAQGQTRISQQQLPFQTQIQNHQDPTLTVALNRVQAHFEEHWFRRSVAHTSTRAEPISRPRWWPFEHHGLTFDRTTQEFGALN